MIEFTPEQAESIDWITVNDGILLVKAGAGCGKSFMSKQIVLELEPKSGIYTAFNKAIVQEGVERFEGTNVECKTFHALAYKYVQPSMSIETLSYRCINENIPYSDKRIVIDTIENFFVSSSTDMYEYFEESLKHHHKKEMLVGICASYVEKMANDEINPTFNFMLKSLHLMMVEETVSINVDIVILDEINDVTAVSLEIFKLIKAPKKLGLGESNQAIYAFLNLVDGFEILKDQATTMYYTQSYRCSEQIASRIESKMKKAIGPEFVFKGTENPVRNGKFLYCTLTNAAIVDEIYNRIDSGKRFKLLRNASEIFSAPLALATASQGKKPYQRKYGYLQDLFEEYKNQDQHKTFFKYLINTIDDDEIHSAVNLLSKFSTKGINLFQLYNEVKNTKPDENFVISTVFTSKGLEYEEVYISDDLNSKFKAAMEGSLTEQDALIAKRCYYVACSRAGAVLRNSVL